MMLILLLAVGVHGLGLIRNRHKVSGKDYCMRTPNDNERTNIEMAICNPNDKRQWWWRDAGGSRIFSYVNDKRLTVENGREANFNPVEQLSESNSNNQLTWNDAGKIMLKKGNGRMVMDFWVHKKRVIMYAFKTGNNNNQLWDFVPAGNFGVIRSRSRYQGKRWCLRTSNNNNGQRMQVAACNENDGRQMWMRNFVSGSIVNYSSGKAIDVASGRTHNGAKVQQWEMARASNRQQGTNQKFTFDIKSGAIRFGKKSSMVLDFDVRSKWVNLWTLGTVANQRWDLVPTFNFKREGTLKSRRRVSNKDYCMFVPAVQENKLVEMRPCSHTSTVFTYDFWSGLTYVKGSTYVLENISHNRIVIRRKRPNSLNQEFDYNLQRNEFVWRKNPTVAIRNMEGVGGRKSEVMVSHVPVGQGRQADKQWVFAAKLNAPVPQSPPAPSPPAPSASSGSIGGSEMEETLGVCKTHDGKSHDVGMQCDGYCVAPLFDRLEAVPMVGQIIKNARKETCNLAKVTAADFRSCESSGHEYKNIGNMNGSTTDQICFAMQIFAKVDRNACIKIMDCIKNGNPTKCVEGFGDQILAAAQKEIKKLENMKDILVSAPDILYMLSPHKMLRCPLTEANPMDVIYKMVKALTEFMDHVPRALIGVSAMAKSGSCKSSVLLGLNIDFQLGPLIKNEEIGMYFTLGKDLWAKIADPAKTADQRLAYVKDLAKNFFRDEGDATVGFYTSSAMSFTSGPMNTEVESGWGVTHLLGGPETWAGYGFNVNFEAGIPNVFAGFGANIEFQLIFSARETGTNDNQVNKLIGWQFGLPKIEFGLEGTPVQVEVGCAFARAATFEPHNLVQKCGNGMKAFFNKMTNMRKDLENKYNPKSLSKFNPQQDIMREWSECTAAAECLAKECSGAFINVGKQASQVVRKCTTNLNFVGKCTSFPDKCTGSMMSMKTDTCINCRKLVDTNQCLSCRKKSCNVSKEAKRCKLDKRKCPCGRPWERRCWKCIGSVVTDGAKCGWNTITKCAWGPVSNSICKGADFTCQQFKKSWSNVADTACTAANTACHAWKYVDQCSKSLIKDTMKCAKWAGESAANCAGSIIEVAAKTDLGALKRCAQGIKKCTTLVPDFVTDVVHGRRLLETSQDRRILSTIGEE